MAIIVHQVNTVIVEQRQADGFINGTAMCVAHGKDISDWLKTDDIWDLVTVLADDLGIKPKSHRRGNSAYTRVSGTYPTLVIVKRGSPEHGGGTWLHPDLSIQLAQWCSAKCAILVSRWVQNWMTTEKHPIQSAEMDHLKLELELAKAQAEAAKETRELQSASVDLLNIYGANTVRWLRGQAPPPSLPAPPPVTQFVEKGTRRLLGTTAGHSLTEVMKAAGLNPNSTKERSLVKKTLARHGYDYDKLTGWTKAALIQEYPVLVDEDYQKAVDIVVAAVVTGVEFQPNLFVDRYKRSLAGKGSFLPSSTKD